MNFKIEAVERAVTIYDEIKEACTRPDKSINGETLQIYKELADWGFFEKYAISDIANKWLYVTVLAMHFTMKAYPVLSQTQDNGKWQIIQSALERSNKARFGKKKV